MYFPIVFLFTGRSYSTYLRLFAWLLIAIFTVGIILSYTRAAWVSLVMAAILFLIYKYRIKFSVLAFIGVSGLILLSLNWTTLMMNMERKKT